MSIKFVSFSRDNISYILSLNNHTLVIDPGEADPFLKMLTHPPTAILLTHEHGDHVNGVKKLLNTFPNTPTFIRYPPFIAHICKAFSFEDLPQSLSSFIDIIPIPGHAFCSVCFFVKHLKAAFVGDTLFAMGCGGVFTENYTDAFHSLKVLKELPLDTKLFWGHNYALLNYRFARKTIEDQNLRQYAKRMHIQKAPGILADELAFNPFLQAPTLEIFRRLRLEKNAI